MRSPEEEEREKGREEKEEEEGRGKEERGPRTTGEKKARDGAKKEDQLLL